MKRVKSIAAAAALALVAVLATGAAAQQTNVSERTFLTFSAPVEMPGVTLPAGTYVFKLADTPSRNVVQVWNEDEDMMLGHWLYVQAERPEVTEETVVMFREEPEGTAPAVQYWYFPGERIGKEFIYPDDQARQIAARTGVDVRTEDGLIEGALDTTVDVAEDVADTAVDVAQEAADVTEDAFDAITPDLDEPEVAVEAEVETEALAIEPELRAEAELIAPEPRAVGTAGQFDELPRTASPLALSGLIGLLSLMGAAGIRAIRQ